MKIGIYADAHFSLNSSIVLGTSGELSGKLDHLIESFKWMYELFRSKGVSFIVDLGDLADSYNLRAEEITAISTALSYNKDIKEYHILGNHERLSEQGTINSVNFINNIENQALITEVSQLVINDSKFTFIPYGIYNSGDFDSIDKTDYAFSHIDVFGSDTGGWKLKSGLDPYYLTERFGLVINGHIHNGSWVIKDKIINLGSITGHNFSSKLTNWEPSVGILDTDTGELELVPNPHALKFITRSCDKLDEVINFVSSLDKNSTYAIQLRVPITIVDDTRNIFKDNNNILVSRVMTQLTNTELGGMTYEEIDKVNDSKGGFSKLIEFINDQESLPYSKDDILKIVSELESDS